MPVFKRRPLTAEKALRTLRQVFQREWMVRFGIEDPVVFDLMIPMQNAWLLEVPSGVTASEFIGTIFTMPRPEPLIDAWTTAFDFWDRSDPVMYDVGLAAVVDHYNLAGVKRDIPPSRLVADWRSDGTPEPDRWVENKMSALMTTTRATP